MIEADLQARVTDGTRAFELAMRFASPARVIALYGPSGAGKSLTLQALAGLLEGVRGRVCVDGRVLLDSARGIAVRPEQRGIGYLFQHYALFPHLSVRENIAFGLTRWWRRRETAAQRAQVDELLARFGLEALAGSRPDALSGGQRQRVALARALACRPGLLLLDEPFSALNPALRGELRTYLAEVFRQWQLPVVLITHDVEDVLALAEIAFVVEQGQVVREVNVQNATATELGAPPTPERSPREQQVIHLLRAPPALPATHATSDHLGNGAGPGLAGATTPA